MPTQRRPTLAGRARRRSLRGLQQLDSRGYLLDSISPALLGTWVFLSVAFVAMAMYFAGQGTASGTPVTLAIIVGWVTALASALALTVSRYQAERRLGDAQLELIATHGELELERTNRRALMHDARAVVGAMSAALHALDRSGQQKEIRAAMTSQVDHLRELLTTPTTTLRPTPLDRFREPLVSFANLHGLSLAVDLPAQVHVLAEPLGVSTILLNLVENARKYSKGSPVRVFWEPAGSSVRICVEDMGPGMPAESEHLFAQGTRGGDTAEGFGLGLATARQLAEQNRGSLWHERRDGPGSRFVLKLVRASAASSEGGTL